MKMKKRIVAGLAVLTVAVGVATVAVAQDKDRGNGKDRDRDELVTLAQTPEVVQQTIQKYAMAADIKKIEKHEKNGQMSYSVEIVKVEKESELDVSADGTLTSADEEIVQGDAPAAVQKALATQAGKAIEISKLTEKGVIQYEATLEQNGEEQEISITAEGQVTAKNDAEEEDGDRGQEGERDGHWGGHKGHGGEGDGHWGNREGDRSERGGQCGERKGRHGGREGDRGEGQGHGEGDKD